MSLCLFQENEVPAVEVLYVVKPSNPLAQKNRV